MLICMASALASRNRVQQLFGALFRSSRSTAAMVWKRGILLRRLRSLQGKRRRGLMSGQLHSYTTRGSTDDDPRCTILGMGHDTALPGLEGRASSAG